MSDIDKTTGLKETLSDEDKAMIKYFIVEKGDIKRWCDYENKKHLIEKELPQLAHAIKMLDIAESTIMSILDSI